MLAGVGLGEAVDASTAKAYPPESFVVIPAGDAMLAFTTQKETVLQLDAEGPWAITYLDSAQ